MARRNIEFQSIRSEGGLLPSDILRRVLDPKSGLAGTQPEDYGLPKGERLNEVVTQSWNRLRRHWEEFRAAVAALPKGEAGTALTNEKWSLPLLRELGFGLLPSGAGPEINGRKYAVSRFYGPVPVHLVGCGLSLDRRAASQRGAAAINPHGLVQELLNRSSSCLWGIVANGLLLRILRDNQALSRQAFLEFDLEAIFEGEIYSDFVLLWLVAHASRFAPRSDDRPESCMIEEWMKEAEEQGTRALGDLRGGVERALQIFGQGFTSHLRNRKLRDRLRSGELAKERMHEQLLRLVYRLIFLFVAEDRTLDGKSMIHPQSDASASRLAQDRYFEFYSTARLRNLAGKIKGSRHGDLWKQFQLVARALSSEDAPECRIAREQLALPSLGSLLWDTASTPDLNGAELTNHDFLEALRHLAYTRQGNLLRPVDYKNLGSEELGGVYETLLALTPQIGADGASFGFAEFAGNERKTSGSYYTPDSLVQCLLDSALDPVVEEAIRGKSGEEAEKAILALKVCDPAVGSGHFLVGAAHRLARHLARVRAIAQGESEPSPLLYQKALRDIIGYCLYGVDINPMSVELCKISLWLEAMEPGKPLSFLDHHIRCGNSLIGATPELIAKGLPDEAFIAIEGDDKKACTVLRKKNKVEREGLGPLFQKSEDETQQKLIRSAAALNELPDDRPEAIQAKELAFLRHEQTEEYRHKKLIADAWCATFVIHKYFAEPGRPQSAFGITQNHLNQLSAGESLPPNLSAEIENLSQQYQFFHWHLAFPEVFAKGGFDCLLGNPPWERIKLQEKEWFAERSPEIANAQNAAARKKLIEALIKEDPELHRQFLDDSRLAEGESHFIRNSGAFPLNGRGDVNTYAVFAELFFRRRNPKGTSGFIVPSGIATDDTTKYFFQELVESYSILNLFDFENRQKIFPGIDSRIKFTLLTLGTSTKPMEFVFFALSTADLQDQKKRFTLTPEDIALLNPNTRTCPIFRSKKDAELTKAIYRRIPVLIREARDGQPEENPWGIKFSRMFDMANDSHFFRTREQLESEGWTLQGNVFNRGEEKYLPLYEAKMIHHFDHRWATYEGLDTRDLTLVEKQNPIFFALPRYWVGEKEVDTALKNTNWDRKWLCGWRDITNTTNERTVVAGIIPKAAVGDKFLLFFSEIGLIPLYANLISFPLDYAARKKLGGTSLKYFTFRQIPILPPGVYTRELVLFILPRVLELNYTTWDLKRFSLDLGFNGPPFLWNEDRRFIMICELNALYFTLYGINRDDVEYIMDTFSIVSRKDQEKYGEYLTKRRILEIYDEMDKVIRSGKSYQTRLDPPPGDPRCCHDANK